MDWLVDINILKALEFQEFKITRLKKLVFLNE